MSKVVVALFVAFLVLVTGIALYTNLKNRDLIPPPPDETTTPRQS